MAAQPKLTPEQWLACRQRWESDPREGFAWLAGEMELPVSGEAVRQKAKKEAWSKLGADDAGKLAKDASKLAAPSSPKPAKTPDADAETPPKEPETKRPVGRPSLYRSEFAELVHNYCLLGATDVELAGFFGVCERTINEWKEAHPDFLQSMQTGKAFADAGMARRLYDRGMGYSHPETKFFVIKDSIEQVEAVKHYPPDTKACVFWLKNRQPDKWRDRQEVAFEDTADTPEDRAARDRALERAFQRAEEEKERMLERAKALRGVMPGDKEKVH